MSPAPAASWTGFYVGGNVGYGWANGNATATLLGASASASETLNGIVGGGQLGYNWQVGRTVLGVEGDIQASGQSKTTTGTLFGASYSETDRINYFGTIRGRLGWDAGVWMPYVTGGWGYGQFSNSATITGIGSVSSSNSHSAWVIGGGAEWMWAPHWSARLEYLYLDTGNITNNYPVLGGTLAITSRVKDNIVRVGANYHF